MEIDSPPKVSITVFNGLLEAQRFIHNARWFRCIAPTERFDVAATEGTESL